MTRDDDTLTLLRAREADLERANETVARLREALEHYACKCWAFPMPDCAQGDLRDCGAKGRSALEADNG